MICLICRKAETVDGRTTLYFERDEMRLTVKDVPAQICLSCGDAYVDEHVAIQLLQTAEDMAESGIMEDDIDYDSII